MGLDFVGSEASWSYSSFGNFRRRLAKEIGIDLDNMVGFGGKIKWNNIKDPIKDLLNHSDCDGHLTPTQCKKIAPRLIELVSKWEDIDFDKEAALLLAKGMTECAKAKKNLEFV